MKLLMTGAAIAALSFAPSVANAQLFGGFDNNTLLAGTAGAALGGVIGSNLAPNGLGDEYTAIGATLGGLAGAAYGNSRSRYGNNPYAGSFNPGFNGSNLAGTVIGAGLGGAIGSNLAGSGVRQEGTAIGAALGGLAGYALANGRSNARYGSGPVPGYGPVGYGPRGPVGPIGPNGLIPVGGPVNGGFIPAGPVSTGPTYVHSGRYLTNTYPVPSVRSIQQRTVFVATPPRVQTRTVIREVPKYIDRVQTVEKIVEKPVVQYVDRIQTVEKIVEKPVVQYVDRVQTVEVEKIIEKPVVEYVDRIVEKEVIKYVDRPSTPVTHTHTHDIVGGHSGLSTHTGSYSFGSSTNAGTTSKCPAGTSRSADGICLSNTVTNYSGSTSYTSGSINSGSYTSSTSSNCPTGTTRSADGICLSSGVTSYESGSSSHSYGSDHFAGGHTSSHAGEYCYSDSSKRYDYMGREIKSSHKTACKH